MKIEWIYILAATVLLSFARADIPTAVKPVSIGLGGFSYYSSGPFADTALTGSSWLEYGTDWGTSVYLYNTDGTLNPQFNERGLPNYLNPSKKLRLLLWPYSVNRPTGAPTTWPNRGNMGVGRWVVTWQGDADIRLNGATFVSSGSSGGATGSLVNGRRIYTMGSNPSGHITVEAINAANPVTDLKVWMPNPADPQNSSLEGSSSMWHPTFLASITNIDLNHLRFMDWGATNQSPQKDWIDRRRPTRVFQHGVLNRRDPSEGAVAWVNNGVPQYFAGNRGTGMAFEYMVNLCNTTNKDMWICVPHLATDDFVTKLAQLIAFGSDGTNPYTSTQANPVYPPLNANLKVWLEYSNEIWSSGDAFPQGNWAQMKADALGISKAQFNARRFCEIWSSFQTVFGGSSRIVRSAAIFTGSDSYSTPFLTELKNYGPTRSPAVSTDIVSPTTYFGNGIQDWAYEQANLTRGTPNQWFHTSSDFVHNTSTGATRPVSVPLNDPYWTSPELATQQDDTFVEWKKRIFSGSSAAGGGPDSTGVGGGFSSTLSTNIFNIFGQHLPIVAYEGGPSLYSDYLDAGDVRDDGITNFDNDLNRQPGFAEIYRIQLNMARAKGLSAHSMFVDVSLWSKYGQWGHLEYPDQPPESSVKWTAVQDWATETTGLRSIYEVLGTRPTFVTSGALPIGVFNTAYSQDIIVTGGEGTPVFNIIGSLINPGLTLAPVPGDPYRYRLSGTPTNGGWNYFYLRVQDTDGDASWQIFSLYVAGGPGTIVESDIRGAFSGASSLPWTNTHTLDSAVTWSGLNRGAAYVSSGGSAIGTDGTGVQLYSATDALRFSVSQGAATEVSSTLESAITDNEYWKFTITPVDGQPLNLRNAQFKLTWRRESYHAPRRLAVMTSVGGFASGQQVYTSPQTTSEATPIETTFSLPDTAAYSGITAPIEFRAYYYGSQYGHQASILGFKLTRDITVLPPSAPEFIADPFSAGNATVGAVYSDSIASSASDSNGDVIIFSKLSGPTWLTVANNGLLSGTPGEGDVGANAFSIQASDGTLSASATLNITVRDQVSAPQIYPAAGTYDSPITVALSTATFGASIRYTTDGSSPTSSTGTLYSAPFAVSSTQTVQAIAYRLDWVDSGVTSSAYTITNSGPGTGIYQQSGSGDLVFEAENYSSLAANGDSKAWAAATSVSGFQGTGYIGTTDTGVTNATWSTGCEAAYAVNFSATGTYYIWVRANWPSSNSNSLFVGKDGTIVGSNFGSTTYNSWVWVRQNTSLSISATGQASIQIRRREDSARIDKIVVTQNSGSSYLSGSASPTASPLGSPSVAAPLATPMPGTYDDSVTLSLFSGTPGASIRYTTDGSTPTSSTGTLYSVPFTLSISGTTTVKSIAYLAGLTDSSVTAHSYTVNSALPVPPDVLTLAAIADRSSQSGNGLGITETLSLYNHYAVKFSLPVEAPSSAVLRVYRLASDNTPSNITARQAPDTWTEEGTVPTAGTAISTTESSAGGQWLEYDVTAYVQAQHASDGIVSFVLIGDLGSWSVNLHSRENQVNPPELVLVVPGSTSTPFQIWRNSQSWPGDPLLTSLPTADPDDDGLANFLEYALLLDPLANSPAPVTIDADDTLLSLSYPRARADVTYSVETSTTLEPDSWSTEGVTQDTTTPVGETATATIPYDPTASPSRFLHLRVTE